jgi:hypothetical protein
MDQAVIAVLTLVFIALPLGFYRAMRPEPMPVRVASRAR